MRKVYQQPLCCSISVKPSALMTTSMVFDSSEEIEKEEEILSRESTNKFDIWEEEEEEEEEF